MYDKPFTILDKVLKTCVTLPRYRGIRSCYIDPAIRAELYLQVGFRIAANRKRRGLSQEALGRLAKLTRASVSNIEGGRQRPPLHTLIDLAAALGVGLADIVPMSPEPGVDVVELTQQLMEAEDIAAIFGEDLDATSSSKAS